MMCWFWVMDVWRLALDPVDTGKNKLATLNAIHLLYGVLRATSSCYCDSLGKYLSENTYFRYFISQTKSHCL